MVRRPAIPKPTRNETWRESNGAKNNGHCLICQCSVTNISRGDRERDYDGGLYECSHIRAWIRGGLNELCNLVVCCRDCNRRMGSNYLLRWVAREYPGELDRIIDELEELGKEFEYPR